MKKVETTIVCDICKRPYKEIPVKKYEIEFSSGNSDGVYEDICGSCSNKISNCIDNLRKYAGLSLGIE